MRGLNQTVSASREKKDRQDLSAQGPSEKNMKQKREDADAKRNRTIYTILGVLFGAAAIALLACYLAGLVTITLLIRTANPGMRLWVQTHLFLAFWEAWNAFTLQIWLNPLLNIAMFIPFGVLLPLAFPRFQRWYWTLAAGLSTSLTIEIVQYFTARGQADVDDLFCNTLGATLGFCLCLAALSLSRREWKAAGLYTILPALSAAVRYLHAPASVGSIADFENMLKLTRLFLAEMAQRLEEGIKIERE